MSEAVEGSDLILYGVSEKYKESANCRLELSYAMQEKVDLVPLMMTEGYKAKGWLGLILGQSLWHAFYDAKVDTEAKFMNQVDALAREIGQRGKAAANHGGHMQQQQWHRCHNNIISHRRLHWRWRQRSTCCMS
jgi:hypothetical protein